MTVDVPELDSREEASTTACVTLGMASWLETRQICLLIEYYVM